MGLIAKMAINYKLLAHLLLIYSLRSALSSFLETGTKDILLVRSSYVLYKKEKD
ncbi:hypothetical protein [Emticicia agri]|uniref:hypothetical protein n=1 Tax=Emticicia agri TaxID=2492393 RepID=UPI0013E9B298|nr:hypothetical protein [Emticicia agri]